VAFSGGDEGSCRIEQPATDFSLVDQFAAIGSVAVLYRCSEDFLPAFINDDNKAARPGVVRSAFRDPTSDACCMFDRCPSVRKVDP